MECVSWSAQWVWYTTLPVGFPGAFDCRLHLACFVPHAGRNTKSLAYWSGMEPQETTFRRLIYLGPFPQQRTPGRSWRQERGCSSTHPKFHAIYTEEMAFSSMWRRNGDILWIVFPCWCTSTNLFSDDSSSPSLVSTALAQKRPAKAGQRENTQ